MGRARGALEAGLGAHVKWLECTHVRVTREHSRRALGSEHSQSLAPRNLGLIRNVIKIHPMIKFKMLVTSGSVSLSPLCLSATRLSVRPFTWKKENGFIFLYFLSNH